MNSLTCFFEDYDHKFHKTNLLIRNFFLYFLPSGMSNDLIKVFKALIKFAVVLKIWKKDFRANFYLFVSDWNWKG